MRLTREDKIKVLKRAIKTQREISSLGMCYAISTAIGSNNIKNYLLAFGITKKKYLNKQYAIPHIPNGVNNWWYPRNNPKTNKLRVQHLKDALKELQSKVA